MGRSIQIGMALTALAILAMGCGAATDSTPSASAGTAAPRIEESSGPETPSAADTVEELTVRVEGSGLVDGTGAPLVLRGVNRSGAEYACAQGFGFFDGGAGPSMAATIAEWGGNAVRVGLNEHCWLGRNGVAEEFAGEAYRTAIADWVDELHRADQIVVIALMWSDAGDALALDQAPMANQDHSVDFWRSVAETFADDPAVMFELYGEPHDISWDCWRFGCITEEGYPAAGMQDLLDAVRSTGAEQPVIISGLSYSNDLSEWLDRVPTDPIDQLVAGLHLYNFNQCVETDCWSATFDPILESYPLVTAELGEDTCDGSFIGSYLDWADQRDVSYLAWTFNAWGDCSGGPDLIEDEDGTPTPYGAFYRDHLRSLLS